MISLLSNKIAVAPIQDPDKSDGGIWIPDIAKERTDQGIVKYVGPKVRDLKIGDYVVFSGYTGTTLQLEQEADGAVIIMRETAVVCVLQAPDTEVSGLYFRGQDGTYFLATYEMAMNLIASSFRNTSFAKNTGFVNPLGRGTDKGGRPDVADYNDEEEDNG